MKTYNTRPPGFLKLAALAFAGFIATTVFVQGTAFATTAASTTITNQATVNYDDSAGNAQGAVNASVDVTVNLVEATPTLSAPSDDSVFSGSSVDYTYTIISNANGVDTYNLTSAQGATFGVISTNVRVFRDSGDTVDITSIDLGATSVATAVTIAATGTTDVIVPSDSAADGSLNGIVAGDTVVVNGAAHTVASITDNPTGTSILELNNNGVANAVTVGMQIGQQDTFIFRVSPTTTQDSSWVENDVNAQDDATAQAADTDTTRTTVNIAPSLTVTKYVRNISNATNGGGNCITVNTGLGAGSVEYCDGTANGEPGDTLEYVIEIVNGATAGTATDVVISDPVPQFTTQSGNIALDPGTGTWSNVATTADNGDFAEIVGGIVYIYAGDGTAANEGEDNGGTSGDGNGEGGRLAGGDTTRGAFQVTIDN
ncbi:hypothetical protein [Kaarinaea lacus]